MTDWPAEKLYQQKTYLEFLKDEFHFPFMSMKALEFLRDLMVPGHRASKSALYSSEI